MECSPAHPVTPSAAPPMHGAEKSKPDMDRLNDSTSTSEMKSRFESLFRRSSAAMLASSLLGNAALLYYSVQYILAMHHVAMRVVAVALWRVTISQQTHQRSKGPSTFMSTSPPEETQQDSASSLEQRLAHAGAR